MKCLDLIKTFTRYLQLTISGIQFYGFVEEANFNPTDGKYCQKSGYCIDLIGVSWTILTRHVIVFLLRYLGAISRDSKNGSCRFLVIKFNQVQIGIKEYFVARINILFPFKSLIKKQPISILSDLVIYLITKLAGRSFWYHIFFSFCEPKSNIINFLFGFWFLD